MTERAVLAGGCFWGMQDLIRRMPGVISTRVGYTGGDVPNATYRNHGTHAEGIEIVFDPSIVSYRQLLELFFQIHDPTTPNRQGNDIGPSYRSAIYYLDDRQRQVARDTIEDVEASGLWPGRVVTELAPVGDFWEAEPEHQDYLERFPNGYTCHFPRPNWVLPRRSAAESAARPAGGNDPQGRFLRIRRPGRREASFAAFPASRDGAAVKRGTCGEWRTRRRRPGPRRCSRGIKRVGRSLHHPAVKHRRPHNTAPARRSA